ncbi:hypothetical protein VTL71DRAFT_1635 [Oculimacula yallundae]|uniref:Uncharacterized protein n=1 Tax=Oculimacula yallundae TaxID=86028 RepID=A0ABR4CBA0_9HELO
MELGWAGMDWGLKWRKGNRQSTSSRVTIPSVEGRHQSQRKGATNRKARSKEYHPERAQDRVTVILQNPSLIKEHFLSKLVGTRTSLQGARERKRNTKELLNPRRIASLLCSYATACYYCLQRLEPEALPPNP